MLEINGLANVYGSMIGEGTKVAAFVEIGNSVIGARCKIQAHSFICEGVTIEDDVFVGPGVVFTNVINPRAFINRKSEFKPTFVRKGATIGAGSVILCGVTIGEYAMVGAGAVVTKDVDRHSLVVGNPARHVKFINKDASDVG